MNTPALLAASSRFIACAAAGWRSLFVAVLLATPAAAQTTAFTYQGTLTNGATPAAGLHDFLFVLYNAATGGTPQGDKTVEDVNVAGGLFTVTLDFGGAVFDGGDRWLEIRVRPGASSGAFTALAPRQAVTATPYAIKAAVASTVPAGSITGNMLADGAVTGPKIAPGAVNQLGSPDGSPAAAVQVNADGLVGLGTANPAAGLHVAASRSFLNPEQLAVRVDEFGGYTRLESVRSVAVQGVLAAVAAYDDSGITLMNMFDPAAPILQSQFRDGEGGFTLLGGAHSVAMKPGILAVGAFIDKAVTLIDVSIPTSPVKLAEMSDGIGGWNELSGVLSVAIDGNLMAVAAATDSAVTLVDITNPGSPVKWVELKDGSFGYDFLAGASSVALSGNLLAIGAIIDNAVTLVDVTNPANPVKRAELRNGVGGFSYFNSIRDVKLSGNLLAVASVNSSTVTLVDVTDPASPVKLSELRDGEFADTLGGAINLAFQSNRLAVAASSDDAVTVFDVTNPVNPAVLAAARHNVGEFGYLGQPRAVAFLGSTLLVGAQSSNAVTSLRLVPRPAGLSSQGWVGIGTARPAGALHVIGDVFVEQANHFRLSTAHFAAGTRCLATGNFSSALGYESQATGNVSVALGYANRAAGEYSTVAGVGTLAGGRAATAFGESTKATGDFSTAMGLSSTASSSHATAMGFFTRANGQSATAMGNATEASGLSSTSMGDSTIASGDLSTAMGERSYASGFASTALGSHAGAIHDGTFVWSDRQAGAFVSTAADQFSIRALGGVRLSNNTNLNFGNQTRQMINLYNADYGIGVQGDAAYFRTGNDFYWYRGGSHSDTRGDAGGGVPLMSLTTSGRLGLGTAAPAYSLDVQSSHAVGRFTTTDNINGAVLALRNTTASPSYLGAINFEDSGTPGQIGYLASHQMIFRVGGQERMNLQAGGLTVNGTFVSSSDRNVKENFSPANARAVLEKVAALPVSEWNYKDDPGTRHLGPMAQDFHAAFRVGPDDKHIATVDADGVALAAIKGLNEKVEARSEAADSRMKKLEAENAELKARLARLEKLLSAQAAN